MKLLAICLLVIGVSGCFQGASKFYLDSDIVTDARFEGRFEAPTNPDHPSLLIASAKNGHYLATYTEHDSWIKLDVVLFRLGTNWFADISQLADNGPSKTWRDAPGGVEILHLATREHSHSVLKLRLTESGMEVRYNYGNPVFLAMRNEPNLKWKVVEGGGMLMDSTVRVRSLVAKFANDDSVLGVFGQRLNMVRTAKEQ